jgi:hypothetical protein
MGNEKCERHESYGMAGISHVNSNRGMPMFGSSITHDRVIRLSICQGKTERSLSQDHYFADRMPLITVQFSAAQFARFITSPNVGDGVPCTISAINGKRMEPPPKRGHNTIFQEELQEDFNAAMADAENLLSDVETELTTKGPMKVSEKKALLGKVRSLVQHVKDNIPFLHKQFTRSMNNTVEAAKLEMETFQGGVNKMAGRSIEEGRNDE